MKILLSILLFITPLFIFSQIKEDKEILKEIIELRSSNSYLKLDTLKLRIKIDDINRKHNLESLKFKSTIDSLKLVIKNIKEDNDSLTELKKQIWNISKNGSIIYQIDNISDVFYINLNCYDLTVGYKDIITLKPIKDENKWRKPQIWGYTQPDNLSLHLYPHNLTGFKLKKGKK